MNQPSSAELTHVNSTFKDRHHIRQIQFTASPCPIVTQGLEKPSEHASLTLGTFLQSSVMAYFRFRKESGENRTACDNMVVPVAAYEDTSWDHRSQAPFYRLIDSSHPSPPMLSHATVIVEGSQPKPLVSRRMATAQRRIEKAAHCFLKDLLSSTYTHT